MTGAGDDQERHRRGRATIAGALDAHPLTVVDKITLGYQRAYPRTRLAVGNLLVGRGPAPDLEALRDHVARRARAFPPLTYRLAPAGWGRLVWAPDPAFDPARHVGERRIPAGSGLAGLRATIEELSTLEIPLTAAPWQVWLLHGQTPDRFMLLFRGSHARMDGSALDLVLGKLFGPDMPDMPDAPDGAVPARRPLPDRRRHSPLALGRAAARSAGWLTRTTTLGPLAARPTGRTRHAWLQIDLDRMRATGRAYGATVNDVFLAALAGALRAWYPPEAMPPVRSGKAGRADRAARAGDLAVHAAVPVSTRVAAQRDVVGNHITTVRIALPYGEASRAGRLDAIRRQTDRLRRDGAPGVAERLFIGAVPAPLRTAALSTSLATRGFALTASNPAGLTGPFEVLGRPVVDAVPVPPVPAGQRLAVLLSGLDDQVRVGFTADASVPGHDRLAALFAAELDALEAAAGLTPNPSAGPVAGPVRSLVEPARPHPHNLPDTGPRPADPPVAESAATSPSGQ